ncbi:MAG: hypothetical protein EDX89_11255 [Acidobacteria bacterium]|nr:MAG: hypothetical protein EDX89_11255 [Acidobacteriota bacterium]MCE7960367.1 hypothetical protein [Acidobacteria bacterium ACB2]
MRPGPLSPATTAALAGMARAALLDGTLDDPETPAILRRIAGAPLPGGRGLRRDEADPDLVLAEIPLAPGVTGLWLTRRPRNDGRLVLLGRLERAVDRLALRATRRLLAFLAEPVVLRSAGLPAAGGAARLRGRGGDDDMAIMAR